MSDFDREAEREKLQEKYEEDTEEREATEKMSELLLQGATMTNAHCSECNDPIFRYDGQEFCATCERPVDRNQEGDTEGEAAARDDGEDVEDGTAADADGDQIQVTSPEEDARVKFGGGSAGNDTAGEPPEPAQQEHRGQHGQGGQQEEQGQQEQQAQQGDEPRELTGANRREETSSQSRPADGTRRGSHDAPPAGRRSSRPEPEPFPQPAGGAAGSGRDRATGTRTDRTAAGSGTDISTAQESLVRTLTRFSQQAEATDDPQRAREYLTAAREAAETLAALRR